MVGGERQSEIEAREAQRKELKHRRRGGNKCALFAFVCLPTPDSPYNKKMQEEPYAITQLLGGEKGLELEDATRHHVLAWMTKDRRQ